jgi:hypothetical protein
MYMYSIYKQRLQPVYVRLHAGLGQAVTGLHLSPLTEAGPLPHNVMFHKNLF